MNPKLTTLISTANMHLKLNHPTLAAPLYYFVMTSERASAHEQSMAASKLKTANERARQHAGLPPLDQEKQRLQHDSTGAHATPRSPRAATGASGHFWPLRAPRFYNYAHCTPATSVGVVPAVW